MLTDLFEIGLDFGLDFALFVLHFSEFHFHEFFVEVERKKNRALHAQIETIFFELIAQNYCFFGFAFYLTTQKVDREVLPQGVLLFLEGEGLMEVEDSQVRKDCHLK